MMALSLATAPLYATKEGGLEGGFLCLPGPLPEGPGPPMLLDFAQFALWEGGLLPLIDCSLAHPLPASFEHQTHMWRIYDGILSQHIYTQNILLG